MELHINSIGCPRCRPDYHRALVDYYKAHCGRLCDTCKERLEKNPLRVLDCKEEGCAGLKAGAPVILDYLCGECGEHFAGLQQRLSAVEIPFSVDPFIVRGLDYYTKTVFEFVTEGAGAQGVLCGGGRYDLLVEQMGGSPTAALGFGMGLERVLMVMEAQGCAFPPAKPVDLYIGSMGEAENIKALELAAQLRREGFRVLCDTVGRSVKAQMRYANKMGARFSCILGSSELERGAAVVKDMDSGEGTSAALTGEGLRGFLYGALADPRAFTIGTDK